MNKQQLVIAHTRRPNPKPKGVVITSDEISEHMAEWERVNGKVVTSPIEVRDFDAIKARSGISPSLKNRNKK